MRKNRYLPIAAILSVCFFITGLKRIAVFAFAGALSVYLIFRVFNGLNRSFWVVLAAVLVMAFGFLYIVLMGAGLYDFLSDKLGINTMGRQELVREYSSYYELSPIFVGKGSGYISKLFSELPDTASVKSIQCDFLLIYIDLGFWGYWAWMALYLPVRIWLITRWQGVENGILAMCYSVFVCLTAMTDNTIYMTFFVAAVSVLIIGKAIDIDETGLR